MAQDRATRKSRGFATCKCRSLAAHPPVDAGQRQAVVAVVLFPTGRELRTRLRLYLPASAAPIETNIGSAAATMGSAATRMTNICMGRGSQENDLRLHGEDSSGARFIPMILDVRAVRCKGRSRTKL